MKQSYLLIRKSFLFVFFVSLLTITSCKKNKDDQPQPIGTLGIQIVIPSGASIDLSKTSVYSLSQKFGVGSDGKATIAYNAGTYEVVFLFNENHKPVMAGIISDDNKEISVATTAQALLYYGLGIMYSRSDLERIAYIKKIPAYPQFAVFKAQLEQLFIANPNVLTTDAYKEPFVKAVTDIHNKPVLDLIGRQIKVQDAESYKSGMKVKPQAGSDENIEILNTYARRAHAYMYKVAYRDNTNSPHTLISQMLDITTSDYDMPVKGTAGLSETSGPQALPLQSNEKESTWKVRIIGPGEIQSGITMTDAEKIKYEDLCVDFFAADLLMPLLLNVTHHSNQMYKVLPNNIQVVRDYIDEVKIALRPSTIDLVKDGEFAEALKDFSDYALWSSNTRAKIYKNLISGIQAASGNAQEFQTMSNIEENQEIQTEYSNFLADGLLSSVIEAYANPGNAGSVLKKANPIDERFTIVSGCKNLEEWTVLSKDNDVSITPKNSTVNTFTNHTLTVSATGDLSTGESIKYVWSTSGQFGYFKPGNVTTTNPTNSTSIIYYAEDAPDESNIETIYVRAYIDGPNGTRDIGTDTAYVNVKSLSIVMKPNGATLRPSFGTSTVTLRLLQGDGTDPIVSNNVLSYKVVWSIPGTYGHLEGNTTVYETTTNSVLYTATDEDVLSGTESITAEVYVKSTSYPNWVLLQEVKGTVKINNDPNLLDYYAPLTTYHHDRNDWHYTNCGVAINPVDDAVSYSVTITLGYGATYSETWNATTPGWLFGYMYGIDPATTGTYYVGYGASWGGCLDGNCDHYVADCSGGQAHVTIRKN